jgi:predicted glycogen debranching enzyme
MPDKIDLSDPGDPHLYKEWLVTNGLGGYASGTIDGAPTRRYHGVLVAALQNPFGRMMMLNGLLERVRLPDRRVFFIGAQELTGHVPEQSLGLADFYLEEGLPVWRYAIAGLVLEKRLLMVHRQNTVHVTYRLLEGSGPLRLGLRPAINIRPHDAAVGSGPSHKYEVIASGGQYEVRAGGDLPSVRMLVEGSSSAFTIEDRMTAPIPYRIEQSRGYNLVDSLWSPGFFRVDLAKEAPITLVASAENWDVVHAVSSTESAAAESQRRQALLFAAGPVASRGLGYDLTLAADQFIITPAGRSEDTARAYAMGDEVRSVIAGYHWFTDWGRDTMISLEGLTLATGRLSEAKYILRTFSHYIRDGLIPNLFPEGEKEGLYHTADATLWYFHAIDRYLARSHDRQTLLLLLPKLLDIVECHVKGTSFGIRVDPADGLLGQGAEGYQLTWMDAKVEDWVVTPRRGKAVEINALWYNALRLLERWLGEEQKASAAQRIKAYADRAYDSFNRRFWYARGQYLYDVVDGENGDDLACRPNQIFAISLPHPILDESRWRPVIDVITKQLLTPVGLRSLAPGDPSYKEKYDGDLRARDAAYHQGTVWAWLIGPFIDAWMKVHPRDLSYARSLLEGFMGHKNDACVGSISEIFDAQAPFTPRGCIAQAWSVAEVLRCWLKTAEAVSDNTC